MKSRHARAASTSTVACAAASFAACAASPGRSSVFDGTHAQYEHSPPTSSRSTSATRKPPSASAPAQCSPGEPPPITITSYSLTMQLPSTISSSTTEVATRTSVATTSSPVAERRRFFRANYAGRVALSLLDAAARDQKHAHHHRGDSRGSRHVLTVGREALESDRG